MNMMKNTGPIFLVQVCDNNASFTVKYTKTFFVLLLCSQKLD